jgi:uncharacterized membrane protein (DUF373 family)
MEKSNEKLMESPLKEKRDPLLRFLNAIVVYTVKILAILMVVVIVWGLVDVFMHLYDQLVTASRSRFNIENMMTTLGAFLAVLIAIEIFLNILFYLKKDVVHVPLVLSTALTAVARKMIVLDYSVTPPQYIYAIASGIFSVGIIYWLVTKK